MLKQGKIKDNDVARALGLTEETRQSSVDMLTTTLASTHVLALKTRKFHWNVTGLEFEQLHELFGEQYAALAAAEDEIAERIRQLGALSIGTLAEMQQHAFVEEQPGENPNAAGMVAELLADHEEVIRHLRADIDATTANGDAGTADFLTGLMEAHEKVAWFLRAHLE
jgi:starvation-inducible DNA-binding protein